MQRLVDIKKIFIDVFLKRRKLKRISSRIQIVSNVNELFSGVFASPPSATSFRGVWSGHCDDHCGLTPRKLVSL